MREPRYCKKFYAGCWPLIVLQSSMGTMGSYAKSRLFECYIRIEGSSQKAPWTPKYELVQRNSKKEHASAIPMAEGLGGQHVETSSPPSGLAKRQSSTWNWGCGKGPIG